MEWPNVTPIKSTRIYQEIARQVKSMIAEGRLKGGDRLPPERDLADKFVVSRTSVREALRALESLGLVEIRPGEGTFVREASIESLVEPLALLMVSQREAIGELFEARRVLEPSLAALAAERATRVQVAGIKRALQAIDAATSRGDLAVSEDFSFHRAIGEATGNPQFVRLLSFIEQYLLDAMRVTKGYEAQRADWMQHVREEHRAIYDAIAAGDPAAARRAAVRHHQQGEHRLAEGGYVRRRSKLARRVK